MPPDEDVLIEALRKKYPSSEIAIRRSIYSSGIQITSRIRFERQLISARDVFEKAKGEEVIRAMRIDFEEAFKEKLDQIFGDTK